MKEKKKGYVSIRKRCLSAMFALIMVLGLVSTTGVQAYAAEAPEGYTTDEHGLVAYKDNGDACYDIIGYVDGEWYDSTYNQYGFRAQVYNGGDNLVVTATPTFVADGEGFKLEYTVTNNGSTAVSDYRLWMGADTAVAGNDRSSIIVNDGALIMTSGDVSFFAISTEEGCAPVATNYGEYDDVCYGKDPTQVAPYTSGDDSAFIMYFPLDTLNAGESKTYTLIVGMGDADEVSGIISNIRDSLSGIEADYANEEISGFTPGASYEITVDGDSTIYQFTASENGTIPVAGSDINGTSYDFMGKTISIVKKGDQTTNDSEPATLDIAARPSIPDSVETIETAAITRTENQITVNAKEGYEYSIDGVTWFKDEDSDGKIVFGGLDNCKEYNIYYRYAATESSFASAANTMNVEPLYGYSEKISTSTESQSGNFAAGGLKNTANELRDAVLTDADKTAIGAGKSLAVWIDMKDATSTVSDSDKTLVTENLPTNYMVGKYLDINLLKQISGEEAVKVTETPGGAVKIGFTIPTELQKSDRSYKIVRIHDGVATVLDTTVDENYELTFETDRFSTYALVYKDKASTTTTTTATTATTSTDTTATTTDAATSSDTTATTTATAAETGDNTNVVPYIVLLMFAFAGFAGVYARRKRL